MPPIFVTNEELKSVTEGVEENDRQKKIHALHEEQLADAKDELKEPVRTPSPASSFNEEEDLTLYYTLLLDCNSRNERAMALTVEMGEKLRKVNKTALSKLEPSEQAEVLVPRPGNSLGIKPEAASPCKST